MIFEWDEAKNRANIRKHGFDFAEAEEMFRSVLVVDPDTREDYGERRWVGVGTIRLASFMWCLPRETWKLSASSH